MTNQLAVLPASTTHICSDVEEDTWDCYRHDQCVVTRRVASSLLACRCDPRGPDLSNARKVASYELGRPLVAGP
jgi:hypothetical protein